MSDLLFPNLVIPSLVLLLYTDFWLIGGSLGLAFCKLKAFVPDVSTAVSIQSLVLIAVDRFGAVVFPLRSPLISSKLCPFFILATWIVALAVNSTEFFVLKLFEYPGELVSEWHWNEVFWVSSSPENYLMISKVFFVWFNVRLINFSDLFLTILLNSFVAVLVVNNLFPLWFDSSKVHEYYSAIFLIWKQ